VYQQIESLHDGRIDVGFVTMPIMDTGLVTERVRGEPLAIALPARHALTRMKAIPPATLAAERLIVMSRHLNPGFYDLVISFLRGAGFSLEISDEADSILASLALVAAGRGIAVLPISVFDIDARASPCAQSNRRRRCWRWARRTCATTPASRCGRS
jgi:DNA-binding transcriptional LysR family regulator